MPNLLIDSGLFKPEARETHLYMLTHDDDFQRTVSAEIAASDTAISFDIRMLILYAIPIDIRSIISFSVRPGEAVYSILVKATTIYQTMV